MIMKYIIILYIKQTSEMYKKTVFSAYFMSKHP